MTEQSAFDKWAVEQPPPTWAKRDLAACELGWNARDAHGDAEVEALKIKLKAALRECDSCGAKMKPKWISIHVDMPSDGDRIEVLGYSDAYRDEVTLDLTYHSTQGLISNITHWRPL